MTSCGLVDDEFRSPTLLSDTRVLPDGANVTILPVRQEICQVMAKCWEIRKIHLMCTHRQAVLCVTGNHGINHRPTPSCIRCQSGATTLAAGDLDTACQALNPLFKGSFLTRTDRSHRYRIPGSDNVMQTPHCQTKC